MRGGPNKPLLGSIVVVTKVVIATVIIAIILGTESPEYSRDLSVLKKRASAEFAPSVA